ncbi:MAG: PAS domain-containing protein [Rubrivivax sp.]
MESPPEKAQAAALRTALLIGAAYFFVGALWILLSDELVRAVSSDVGWLMMAQRNKGLVYVTVTALALVYLVHLGCLRLLAMQQRVEDSDLRMHDLFMNHPQPMWVYDMDSYRFLLVNDAAVAAYGYRREAFLAMTARDIRPPEDVPSFLAAARLHAVGTGSPGVFRHRTRSGRTLLARISEHRVVLHGRPAMMVMAEDVTIDVALQNAVQRQQRQFQQLHQSLGEVLWMATPDGASVLYVSPAFATIYGRKPAELLADPLLWRECIHPEDRDRVPDLAGGEPGVEQAGCEYRIVRPDGSVRWIQDRRRLIRDETGQVTMMGGIAEDVTARRERDEARDAMHSKLEAMVVERTRDLEQANIELEAFSRTAAHDLRSPLNGIVGMSQLLRMKASTLDGSCRGYLDLIERSARDMAGLISDLLALSRAGSVPLDPKPVDLAPLARGLVDELRLLEPQRRARVSIPDPLELCCDEGLMRSVLQNLITNAWKFSARCDETEIALTVERGERETTLTVSDRGTGFDASAAGELLRPFQRFHSQAQFQGTGLGLVTCQRIAHRHGGRLLLKSAPGQGTRVSIVLPNLDCRGDGLIEA